MCCATAVGDEIAWRLIGLVLIAAAVTLGLQSRGLLLDGTALLRMQEEIRTAMLGCPRIRQIGAC